MDNDLDQNEEYDNQSRLNALKDQASKSNNVPEQTVGGALGDAAVDAVKKSVASKKIKQIVIKYVLPVIGISLLFMIIVFVIIGVGCAEIPLSSLFSDTCKNFNMTSEEKKEIKSTYGIDNIANDICSQNGGAYNSDGNNCGKGY